jgi:hypothetical protein
MLGIEGLMGLIVLVFWSVGLTSLEAKGWKGRFQLLPIL